jgi:hypothetical protein
MRTPPEGASAGPPAGPLPRAAPTGVGSLPFTDTTEAVEFVGLCCPEFPFWPQLPRRSPVEGSIAQFLGPVAPLVESPDGIRFAVRSGRASHVLDRLVASDGALPRDRAAGFHAFAAAAAMGVFPEAVAFKGQLTGPLTLGLCLTAGGRPLAADPAALDVLAGYVGRGAVWQLARLPAAASPTLVCVDEPCLAALPPDHREGAYRALAVVFRAIRAAGGRAGLHCCAHLPFDALSRVGPDFVSFDAHAAPTGLLADECIARFVDGGGWVGLGVVPTGPEAESADASRLAARLLPGLLENPDPGALVERILITATCGLGLSSPPGAHRSFRVAREVGERLGQAVGPSAPHATPPGSRGVGGRCRPRRQRVGPRFPGDPPGRPGRPPGPSGGPPGPGASAG